MNGLLVFSVILALVGAGAVYGVVQDKKRREALQAFALRQGFDYLPEHNTLVPDEISWSSLLSKGRRRSSSNFMKRRASDGELSIFDFRYTTGSGKNSHTQVQTVFLFNGGQFSLPAFMLMPENFLIRLVEHLGYQDIDFPEDQKFSDTHLLRGPSEAVIRRLFGPAVREFFSTHPGLAVEADGNRLLIFKSGTLLALDQFPEMLETGARCFELLRGNAPAA